MSTELSDGEVRLLPIEILEVQAHLTGNAFILGAMSGQWAGESDTDYVERMRQESRAALYDHDGERIASIERTLLKKLAPLDKIFVREVINCIGLQAESAYQRGIKNGTRHGRKEVIDFAHELLGIDRICAAITERE